MTLPGGMLVPGICAAIVGLQAAHYIEQHLGHAQLEAFRGVLQSIAKFIPATLLLAWMLHQCLGHDATLKAEDASRANPQASVPKIAAKSRAASPAPKSAAKPNAPPAEVPAARSRAASPASKSAAKPKAAPAAKAAAATGRAASPAAKSAAAKSATTKGKAAASAKGKEYVIFVLEDNKDGENLTYYLQWNGNEEELRAFKAVQTPEVFANMGPESYTGYFKAFDKRVPEAAAKEHVKASPDEAYICNGVFTNPVRLPDDDDDDDDEDDSHGRRKMDEDERNYELAYLFDDAFRSGRSMEDYWTN